jgi:hypothetical protein
MYARAFAFRQEARMTFIVTPTPPPRNEQEAELARRLLSEARRAALRHTVKRLARPYTGRVAGPHVT